MRQKHSAVLLIALSMMAMLALPARASILTSATATANCQGYQMTVNADELTVGTAYTIAAAPLLAWWAIVGFGIAALLILGLGVWRRARGVAWRFRA